MATWEERNKKISKYRPKVSPVSPVEYAKRRSGEVATGVGSEAQRIQSEQPDSPATTASAGRFLKRRLVDPVSAPVASAVNAVAGIGQAVSDKANAQKGVVSQLNRGTSIEDVNRQPVQSMVKRDAVAEVPNKMQPPVRKDVAKSAPVITSKANDTGMPKITGTKVGPNTRRYTMGDNASLTVYDNTGSGKRTTMAKREQVGNPARGAQQKQFQKRMSKVGTGRKFGATSDRPRTETNWNRDSKPDFNSAGAGFSGSAKDAMIASAKRKYANEQRRSDNNLRGINAIQAGQTERQVMQDQTSNALAQMSADVSKNQEIGRNARHARPSGDALMRGALNQGKKNVITPKWVQKRNNQGDYLQEGFNSTALTDPFKRYTSEITDEELLK